MTPPSNTGELGYDGPHVRRILHMTDDMLGPSPMHIKYSSYVYDGFCIWRTNFPGPIESFISKFTCIFKLRVNRDASHKATCPCGHWLSGTNSPLLCCHRSAVPLLVVLERAGISLAPKYSTPHTALLYQIFNHFLNNHIENWMFLTWLLQLPHNFL